MFVMACKYRK